MTAEVESLLGDATKAHEKLGWKPQVSFPALVHEMIREDFKEAQRDQLCQKEGFATLRRHE